MKTTSRFFPRQPLIDIATSIMYQLCHEQAYIATSIMYQLCHEHAYIFQRNVREKLLKSITSFVLKLRRNFVFLSYSELFYLSIVA
jgi:hypothetical protein